MKISSCPSLVHLEFEIRHLESSDAPAWFEYASDHEAMKYTSSRVEHVRELEERILKINSKEPGTLIQYAIASSQSRRLIGTIGFHTISETNRSAEITYDVNPGYWGKGLASASCSAAVDWAFAKLGWVRVQATVLEENIPSIRVLEKCGFELEGILRNFRMIKGKPHDFRIFSRVP